MTIVVNSHAPIGATIGQLPAILCITV